MTPGVVVFLNNKLISADTILPVLIEVLEIEPTTRIEVVTFAQSTLATLRRNSVIWDALSQCGHVRCWQRDRNGGEGWLRHKLRVLFDMVQLHIFAYGSRRRIIHFGSLKTRILQPFFFLNRSRTYMVESNPIGFSKTMNALANLKRRRADNHQNVYASRLFVFSKDWPLIETARAQGVAVEYSPPLKDSDSWRAWVRSRATDYLESSEIDTSSGRPIITFLLRSFDRFDFEKPDADAVALFEATIDRISLAAPNVQIVLKPHAITQMHILVEVMNRRQWPNVIVSYLNPSFLATISRVFVCNYFSTALSDARFFGVRTSEVASYSEEALRVTGGASMRPDYVDAFFKDDLDGFERWLRDALADSTSDAPSEATSPDGASVLAARILGYGAETFAERSPIGDLRTVGRDEG